MCRRPLVMRFEDQLSLLVYFEDQLYADWAKNALAQNYRCLRKVSYFSGEIGIGQNATGCGFRGSAIWRLCILTFCPKTTVVCEKFHI